MPCLGKRVEAKKNEGVVCTIDASSTMQVRRTTSINPDTIYGGHGADIKVIIPSSFDRDAYGLQRERPITRSLS